MGFIDDVKMWADRARTLKSQVRTEEAVKHSLVMPFLQILGYNVFDPTEIVPEFTADIGLKKGEKVDYAIFRDGEPHVLIEVKYCGAAMDCFAGQLYRYFGVTKAKFGILTDGIVYKFYSDLDEPNKMDTTPFLTLDLGNMTEAAVHEVEKFHKKQYEVSVVISSANELKHTNRMKEFLSKQMKDPDNEFTRFVLKNVSYGHVSQQTLQRFKPIIKRSFILLIGELVDEKIRSLTMASADSQIDLKPITPIYGNQDRIHEPQKKDYTRYSFGGASYCKRKLVLAVINRWLKEHKPYGLSELLAAFPQKIRSGGMFVPVDDAKGIYNRQGVYRHFLGENEIIRFADSTQYAISNQWGKENIEKFLNKAKKLGYEIQEIS